MRLAPSRRSARSPKRLSGLPTQLSRKLFSRAQVVRLPAFEEFRLYHRKDGKVVKEGDDLLCATGYALMMLRFASVSVGSDDFMGGRGRG